MKFSSLLTFTDFQYNSFNTILAQISRIKFVEDEEKMFHNLKCQVDSLTLNDCKLIYDVIDTR